MTRLAGMLLSHSFQRQLGMPQLRNKQVRPLAVAAILLVLVTAWLVSELPKGILTATDELLTAERTREMIVTGEKAVVHFNFRPSFEKPPLQYWLTSFTLPEFQNPSFAVRIWTLIYGVGTAIVLAWLATLIEPEKPWLVPLTVAVLLACPLFSTQATRGLLDIGLAFFTTLAVAFSELARKRPCWWFGVAIACWLGSLQKVPFPFLVWLLILLVRATSPADRPSLRSKWLIVSLLAAAALVSIWPLIQVLKYNMPFGAVFYDQVVTWTGPTRLGSRPYFEVPLRMAINGGPCAVLGLAAPFVLVFRKDERVFPAARQLALVSLMVVVLVIVSNFRHVRYVIPIIPCLCLLLGLVFYRLFAQTILIRRLATVALAIVLMAGLAETEIQVTHLEGKPDKDDPVNRLLPFLSVPKDVANEKLIAEKLGALQGDRTKIVLIESEQPGADLLWNSFYLFHGKLRSAVTNYTPDQLRERRPVPPLIGVCVTRDFPVVQELYPNAEVRLARAQFICWQVPADASATTHPKSD